MLGRLTLKSKTLPLGYEVVELESLVDASENIVVILIVVLVVVVVLLLVVVVIIVVVTAK